MPRTRRVRSVFAMLSICDRVLTSRRRRAASSRGLRAPIIHDPHSLGAKLRTRRFELGLNQVQAAVKLGVSKAGLSTWECGKRCPSWTLHPRIVEYLGFDPFENPTMGTSLGNTTRYNAILSSKVPLTFGQKLLKSRVESKKTAHVIAKELGVNPRTLHSWENGSRQPSPDSMRRILALFGPGILD